MLKRELEEQNEQLRRENAALASTLQDIDLRLNRHESSIRYCVDCSEKIIELQESMSPFQQTVQNWLGAVKETLEFQSSRISFVEERAERLEKGSEKLELYYRGLTQTMRQLARHFKAFRRKIDLLMGQVGSLTECASRPKGLRALWAHWRDRR